MKKTVFLFLALWIFKVEAQTPVLVKDFQSPYSGVSLQSIIVNNSIIFEHQGKIWRSDGTEVGTITIKEDLHIATQNDVDEKVRVIINGILYFAGHNSTYGTELWKSDGTSQGTILVSDIEQGYVGSTPFDLINLNGTLFFFTSSSNLKLWKLSVPVVPVELITFTAKPTNNKVQLDWKTAAELNTLGYDIERSTDGQTWSKLGFVGAKNLPSEYQYFDQNPKLNEVNYYRLCTVDIDGKKEFSKIVSVKMNEVRSPIKIYPSVTEGVIQIETTLNIQQVWVSNASGQIVLTSTQSSLNLGSFPTGVYVVTVKGGDSIFSETVFKQ